MYLHIHMYVYIQRHIKITRACPPEDLPGTRRFVLGCAAARLARRRKTHNVTNLSPCFIVVFPFFWKYVTHQSPFALLFWACLAAGGGTKASLADSDSFHYGPGRTASFSQQELPQKQPWLQPQSNFWDLWSGISVWVDVLGGLGLWR